MTDKGVGIVSSENGKDIINGLNLLAIFATHPLYSGVIKTILVPQISQHTGIPHQKLMQDVHHALNYIDEINKTLTHCESFGIQFGLAVQKEEHKPNDP